jgi:leader peptidase (prepilin peptidase)/N-methyltransferase
VLRAKCRHCGGNIIPRYFLVELLVAVLFLLVWLKFTNVPGSRPLNLVPMTDWALVPVYWLMVSGLVLGTFVDFEHLIIPDRVTLGGIVAGLILSLLVPAMHGTSSVLRALIAAGVGAAAGWSILWGIGYVGRLIFKKDAMGFGDVKLLGAIGAFLGWKAVIFTLMMSSFAGSIVGVTLVLLKNKEMQSRIPYGPYIALAAVIWIFWGPALWDGYLNLFPAPAPYGP